MTNSPENFSANRSLERQIPGCLWSSEIKLLGAAVFWANPTTAYALSDVMEKMTERQGEHPAWRPTEPEMGTYFRQNLVPGGTVFRSKGHNEKGRRVSVYQANTDDPATKLAYAGSFFTWGLDHPEIPQWWLYGSALAKDKLGAPEKQHRIYKVLDGHPGTDLRITDIAHTLRNSHPEKWSIRAQLILMAERKLLEVSTNDSQNPEITIESTKYTGKRSLDTCIPETQAAYEAMRRLGEGTVTLHDIVAKSLEINAAIDPTSLRRELLRGARGNKRSYPGLKTTQTYSAQRSSVRINPDIAEPIKDLYERLEAVEQGNKATIDKYASAAERIVNHDSTGARADFRSLIVKGRANPNGSRDFEQLDHRLAEVVTSLGAATVKEATDALLETHPDTRPIPVNTVRSALVRLVESGVVTSEPTQKPNSRRSVTIFRPKQLN